MALTDIQIKRSKPGDQNYKIADGRGFYLLITTGGGKLWRWDYRFEGKRKTMALGKYPDVSLADARAKHSEGRKLLISGVDPMAARLAEKAAEQASAENSFQSVAHLWLAHWQDGKSPRHVDYVKRRMKTKWGSCSRASASIRFNTDLAKKPPEWLEYIVVHEMAHLIEPTHNDRFTALLDRMMPNWRFCRQLLNQLPVRHENWRY